MSSKRQDYLEWQEYFMSIAFLSAQRSKDPRTQVGACIVNKDNKIVGIGYNGMPIGCGDDAMPWNRAADDTKESWYNSKSPYVCHAELNAVLNKNQANVTDCTIYVALFPCNMCAQIIIQSGIKEVVYYSDKYHDRLEFVASRRLLDTAGVKYRQFRPRQKQVIIQFDKIEESSGQDSTTFGNDEKCNGDMDCPVSESNKTSHQYCPSKENSNNKNVNNTSCGMANNNNIVKRKNGTLFNHAEQQNLPQNIGEELFQNVHETLPHLEVNLSRDAFEFRFAVYSLVFLTCVMAFSWVLVNTKYLSDIN